MVQRSSDQLQQDTGYILKKIRRSRRMTQQELAGILSEKYNLDYSVSQISRFEKGTSVQPMEYVMRCCMTFGFHPVSFMVCLMNSDKNWQKVSMAVNSGDFFYNMLQENYGLYGDQLLSLSQDDMHITKRLVQAFLSERFAQTNETSEPELKLVNAE